MDVLAGIEKKGKKVRIVVTVDDEINEILESLSAIYGTDKNRVLEKIISNLSPTLKNRLIKAQKSGTATPNTKGETKKENKGKAGAEGAY
ncbi:MAG: hypothetical protein M1276_02690 [Deltaproteobacteria bacterium]|nr:hypothetical protein [Deltaproteobacteria bacterium]